MKTNQEKPVISRIKESIYQAVLAGEKEKAEALKYLYSLLEKESYRVGKFGEEEACKILQGEMKRKKEALILFEKGGRADLMEKEKKEIKWLEDFLPSSFSEEEIKSLIEKTIKKGESFGQAMGRVMALAKGRASGAEVARILKEEMGIKGNDY